MIEVVICPLCTTAQLLDKAIPVLHEEQAFMWCGQCPLPDGAQVGELIEVEDDGLHTILPDSEGEDYPAVTCPRCGRTSYHSDDIREGYCAFCHDWTSPREDQR